MRILYLDIDSLRPDHLGCYGYPRQTSPHIDELARSAVRFDAVYASDVPCLPSRSAMFSGRFGIRTGIVNHGGTGADPTSDGPSRGFSSLLGRTSWMRTLRDVGLHTMSVSPFAERHSAWHFYANFCEMINPGRRGLESADEIAPHAIEWLQRHGHRDNWFVHVNLWDPHTPYRAPDDYTHFFASAALPSWLNESVREQHWQGCGPHSAQEAVGYRNADRAYKEKYPKQPDVIDSMAAVRAMFDGYDAGVRYADHWIGEIMNCLTELGIASDCAILVSADHGENLGELNVYGDHQTADETTCRVPCILRWPGVTDSQRGRVDRGFHYQFDIAATITELVGSKVPDSWDGVSFADELRSGHSAGRPQLVLSQGAWTCQRSLRFREGQREFLMITTLHDAFHGFPERMLFDLREDPHQQTNLADQFPQLVRASEDKISDWQASQLARSNHQTDPLQTVLHEGGPKHTRGELHDYLNRLRATGRGHWADMLQLRHS